uniref:Ubiquitin carboxyl-terminal hydrolase n=1 Tax=Globodera pallida TaxID=36090 RepID=A0A183CAR3_GLOPA
MFDIEMNSDTEAYKQFHSYLSEQKLYLKGPERAELVFKDECLYCFDTPFSTGGLFVSLHTFVGVCGQHIKLVADKTSSRIFLNIQKVVELSEEPKDKKPCLKLDKEQQQIKTEYSLRIYPLFTVPLPITEGAEAGIPRICEEIIAHVSAELQQRLNSGISEWDGEERTVAKAAEDLVQLNYEGPSISYSEWECANCGLKENLWFNLTDGAIMCGRFAQMAGIKGNGHAKAHFESTGFPLVVKLGTIENEDGDIYSYDEDAPVRDPWLAQHLAHFGLDINKFRKTEKTTLELELDANLKHEFSTIQEEGLQLVSVAGPGFTGLINLGSSCYINSALQVLLIVPDFARVFTEEFLLGKQPAEINEDFTAQLAKERGIRPATFRRIVGRGHSEFSTAKQQDVEEYVRYLFEKIDACSAPISNNPVDAFRFRLVTRFVDELSNCVRYSFRTDTILSVAIPVDLIKESNIAVNGVKRKSVTLEGCLTAAFEEEFIDDYLSPVLRIKGRAKQEQRMGSFPDFLFMQLRRFTFDGTRGMRKLDVDVHFPDELDLSAFYSTGELQPGEQSLPEDADETSSTLSTNKPTCPEPNQKIVNELLLMGFTENAAKKATLCTKNESLESATNWILQHMDDSDLNEPYPVLSKQSVPPSSSSSNQGQPTRQPETRNGSGRYRLRAFISHMGSSPHSGHYVAHVKAENGKWHIFNDEKVAESQHPPKTLGYVYLFQRVTE